MKHEIVLVTGATGFIGSHLVQYLLARHYQVIALTRRATPPFEQQNLSWIGDFNEITFAQIDYVINLAGESIGQGRWSKARKKTLMDSRIETTHALYQYLEQHKIYPKCIISASAVGYYGIDPTEQWQQNCTEQADSQAIFMSELCQYWERSALSFFRQNTKIIRMGIVFGQNGGILSQMLLPIKLNLFGRMGHGRQPLVWVHLEDVLSAIEFLMQHDTAHDIFNLVAPSKNRQYQFAKFAAQQLNRKPFFSLPSTLLKYILGEQSQLILNGQFVTPYALEQAGFQFKFTQLEAALSDLLPSRSTQGLEHEGD